MYTYMYMYIGRLGAGKMATKSILPCGRLGSLRTAASQTPCTNRRVALGIGMM